MAGGTGLLLLHKPAGGGQLAAALRLAFGAGPAPSTTGAGVANAALAALGAWSAVRVLAGAPPGPPPDKDV